MDLKTLYFIEKIYDTVTNPNHWEQLLEEYAEYHELRGANIFCWDGEHSELSKAWMTTYLRDLFPRFLQSGHLEEEARGFANGVGVQAGIGLIDSDAWMTKATQRNGIHVDMDASNRWLKAHADIHHRFSSSLNTKPGYHDFISLHAGENYKQIEPALVAQTNVLLPHIKRALFINRPFTLLQERYNAVLEVLDKFKLGVLIVDYQLHVVLQNQSAERMVALDNCFRLKQNNLVFRDPSQRNVIAKAIKQVQINSANTTTQTLNKNTSSLPYLCHVSRIDLSAAGESQAKYLLVLIDPEHSDIVDIDGLSKVFKLTRRESDIAQGIVSGYSNQEIAEINSITSETVKTHVKSISQKTQCKNRVDIVRLAHNINIPVEPLG